MNIAVFWPNWVGDAVMATPAARALREHFAGAYLLNVCKPYVAGVVEGAPWGDHVLFFDSHGPQAHRSLPAIAQLRRAKIDLAVLFPNSFHAALLAWLGNCRRRVGYNRYARACLLTDRLEPLRDARGKLFPSPVIDAYNRIAEHLGCTPSHRIQLFTIPRDEAAADTVWHQADLASHAKVVCLSPGGAFGSAKHWPTEYFARLARLLVERLGCGVLVLCGPAERETARTIANMCRMPAVTSLADQALSLGLTKACVRRCDLLITTDSGPRHFAAAFDRPVITLFGPTHIAWTETYFPKAVHLQKPVECGPCQQRVCPLDHRCMKTLMPEEVFEAAETLLKQRGSLTAGLEILQNHALLNRRAAG